MLVCSRCGLRYPEEFRLRCDCGGTLFMEKNLSGRFGENLRNHFDIRRYLSFLPISEGHLPIIIPAVTPIVELALDGVNVLFKLEYLQPTGSFKDRGTYVTIANLMEKGLAEVVLDSSGNAALSLAAFSKAEGVSVHIFVPVCTSSGKLELLKRLGTELHVIDGSRMEVHRVAIEFAERRGITYVSH